MTSDNFHPPNMRLCAENYQHLRPNCFARRPPLPLPTALELMLAHYRYGRYQTMLEPMLSHCRRKCMHKQSLNHARFSLLTRIKRWSLRSRNAMPIALESILSYCHSLLDSATGIMGIRDRMRHRLQNSTRTTDILIY